MDCKAKMISSFDIESRDFIVGQGKDQRRPKEAKYHQQAAKGYNMLENASAIAIL